MQSPRMLARHYSINFGTVWAAILLVIAVSHILESINIEIAFGGDKSEVLLCLGLGIPLGTVTGIFLCNRDLNPRKKLIWPIILGFAFMILCIVGTFLLIPFFGLPALISLPFTVPACALFGVEIAKKISHNQSLPQSRNQHSPVTPSIGQTSMTNCPPIEWTDKDAWDHYFEAVLLAGRIASYPDPIVLRFLKFAHEKGGRIWFPGCGLDPYPTTYAKHGCKVLATDFSPVAVKYQKQLAAAFQKEAESAEVHGTLVVAEQDFTQCSPDGKFDVVINCHAFQGLSSSAMVAAARHFYVALRPGGVCIIDTMNVQGNRRNLIEDSLIAAGFYIPFQKSNLWYSEQLNATGIAYWMVLGRPRILAQDQSPPEQSHELAERDQQILDSLQVEYQCRCQEEAAEVTATTNDPTVIVAHVVYSTG